MWRKVVFGPLRNISAQKCLGRMPVILSKVTGLGRGVPNLATLVGQSWAGLGPVELAPSAYLGPDSARGESGESSLHAFALDSFYRQIFAPADLDLVLPTYFYTRRLWHQGRFARKPPSFYTKKHLYDLLHAGPSLGCKRVVLNNFAPKDLYTKNVLHQTAFTPE